jgi:hypothetical protein
MQGFNCQYAVVYIDYIIVVNRGDSHDHLRVLKQVIELLHKYGYGLKLRKEKSGFATKEMKSLDHLVSTTKHSFLSMFSPCAASVLKQLQNVLTKVRTMTDCCAEHDQSFEASKTLFNGEELCHCDQKPSSEAHTDASAHTVWCVSVSLSESQKNWGSTHRELLTVKDYEYALQSFVRKGF